MEGRKAMSVGKKTGNILVWGILLLLVAGLTGFGVTNFGGSVQSIGTVGDTEITVDSYFSALTRELRAAEEQSGNRMTLAEAESRGLVTRARSSVITDTTLDNEIAGMGISVGDEQVRAQLLAYDAFKGPDGALDREAYRFTLQQNGLTEAEFEETLRGDTARALLQGAILAGTVAPDAYGKVLFDYIGARRSYALIELTAASLDAPVGAPDAAQLQAYYDTHTADFTAPASKTITYAWLTPDMLIDSIEVDEDTLKALYDARIDEFMQPERRLVERLVFPSEAEAQAAKDRLDAGEVTFETLVQERGLQLSDVDLGDVARADLGAAGDAVFALDAPGVAGPLASDFGPALIRMNAVLEAREISFGDAAPDLRAELALDRARRRIADGITDIDDQLAAGATLEELARDTDMQLGTLAYFDGQDQDIAGYDAFRAAAAAAQQGDFPEVADLEDGGIFALRVDAENPAQLRPLDDVRDDAVAGWQAQETIRQLSEKAASLKALLDAGDAIETLGLTVETAEAVTRGGVAPPELTETVFALPAGAGAIVPAETGAVYLVQVTAVLAADADDQSAAFLKGALEQQAGQGIAQDLFTYFTQSRLTEAGLTLNDAAIRAVHTQFP
ncbi:peptidyl-prolyl cis-trans isomerase [Actibacterium sp. D379-3]